MVVAEGLHRPDGARVTHVDCFVDESLAVTVTATLVEVPVLLGSDCTGLEVS